MHVRHAPSRKMQGDAERPVRVWRAVSLLALAAAWVATARARNALSCPT